MPAGYYRGGGATVRMYPPPAVYVMVFREGGEPAGYLKRKAEKVAMTARVLAPTRSYALRSSIRVDRNRNRRGHYAFGYSVYSDLSYAHYVHEGTGPSFRFKYPGRMVFQGTNAYIGRRIHTHEVFHPGTPANPFLRKALIGMVD